MAAGATVGAFFRAQAEEAAHSHWQIIQVAETPSPGEGPQQPEVLQVEADTACMGMPQEAPAAPPLLCFSCRSQQLFSYAAACL